MKNDIGEKYIRKIRRNRVGSYTIKSLIDFVSLSTDDFAKNFILSGEITVKKPGDAEPPID